MWGTDLNLVGGNIHIYTNVYTNIVLIFCNMNFIRNTSIN